MTLKDMMLGSAIAALVAGGAVAQSTSTDTETPDAGASTEAPMADTDSGAAMSGDTGTSTDTEMSTDTDASSDTGTSMDTGASTDTEMSTDTDTGTSMDTDSSMDTGAAGDSGAMDSGTTMDSTSGDAAPDAGSTMAPEGDAMAPEGTDTMAPESTDTMAPETDLGATDGAEAPMSLEAMTVDDVVGASVMGINDENIGDVNYVIEQSDGLAFVVGVGGFLGIGEHSVAIPADQFTVDADGNLVLSSMAEEDLEAMPEFSTDGVESLEGSLVIGDLMSDS